MPSHARGFWWAWHTFRCLLAAVVPEGERGLKLTVVLTPHDHQLEVVEEEEPLPPLSASGKLLAQ